MLTKQQIEDLPKGSYSNQKLMEMFPKQQGRGNSSYFLNFNKENEKPDVRTGWYIKGRKLN